jgi:hypothetical protein
MKKVIYIAVAALLMLTGDYARAVNSGPASQTGTVSGKVFTPASVAAADARVELVMSKDSKLSAKTDTSGYFIFAGVPVGANYTLTATKLPYKPATKTGVSVTAQKTTSVNLVLKQ